MINHTSKAIIFDMDDVILPSSQFDYPAWQRLFSDFGQRLTTEIYKSFLGMKGTEIIRKFIPSAKDDNLSKLQDRKELYFIDLLKEKGVKMTTGLSDLLDEIKNNFKLGVATSAPKIKVNAILLYLNLQDYFSIIIRPAPQAKSLVVRRINAIIENSDDQTERRSEEGNPGPGSRKTQPG